MYNNTQIADSFIDLLEVLRRLRSPGGCDWDQSQTSESLVPYLLEETYEIIEAIEQGDIETLQEELGDLTLHILFQAELAREANQFSIADSLKQITQKLIRRHPQIFDKNYSSKDGIKDSWESAKQKEKKRENIIDGVPKNLPALIRAKRVQEKAANVGFDWKELKPVLEKVNEEVLELKEAIDLKNYDMMKDELGDTLFSIVNLSRFLKIDPENALKNSIIKFESRFTKIERELEKRGKNFSESNLDEMDSIWNEIKKSVL